MLWWLLRTKLLNMDLLMMVSHLYSTCNITMRSTEHCVNHWHYSLLVSVNYRPLLHAICGRLISFKDFAAVVTRTTPRCSCVRGWRRSRCRWGGTSSLSAPWPPPELPPRTEHRVALFKQTQRHTVSHGATRAMTRCTQRDKQPPLASVSSVRRRKPR